MPRTARAPAAPRPREEVGGRGVRMATRYRLQAAALDELEAAHFGLQEARHQKPDAPFGEPLARRASYEKAVARRREAIRACTAAGTTYADAAGRMGLTPQGALWLYWSIDPDGWEASRGRSIPSAGAYLNLGPEVVTALRQLQGALGVSETVAISRARQHDAAVEL